MSFLTQISDGKLRTERTLRGVQMLTPEISSYKGITETRVTGTDGIVSKTGLTLAYDMETLTVDGKMRDFSGNGWHGTINGTSDITGRFGRARAFSTLTDYITIWLGSGSQSGIFSPFGANPGNATFSLSLWYLSNGNFTVQQRLFTDNFIEVGLLITSDTRRLITYAHSANDVNVILDATPRWYHFAVVYNKSLETKYSYVDGKLIHTAAVVVGNGFNDAPIRIGLDAGPEPDVGTQGTIDEVLLFSRALADYEIAALAREKLYGYVPFIDIKRRDSRMKMKALPQMRVIA